MEQTKTYAVIGGDSRLYYAAEELIKRGCSVQTACMETMETARATQTATHTALKADTLVFGLPLTKDGKTLYAPFGAAAVSLFDIYDRLSPGQTVFAGMLSPAAADVIETAGARSVDYFRDEPLTLYNAMLTAEALTGLLIAKLPCAVFGAGIAITGYGRIAFYLARMLKTLGAEVTVFARNRLQLAKARTVGIDALPLAAFAAETRSFRAVVNTVPAPILGENELKHLNNDCLLLEAASAPYGISEAAAVKLRFPYFLAGGLPGKYAPESAGKLIADTVLRLEREVNERASP